MKQLLFITGLLALLLSSFTQQKRPVHIFMAGDSTMALKPLYKNWFDPVSGDSIPEVFPERGWGQLLVDRFSENVIIENHARNGRSTRTFIEEGRWDKIVESIRPGDYVIIQFGHNDSAEDKKERYTPPTQYKTNLSRFIEEVKDKKGIPILCTPVARRYFTKEGNLKESHGEYVQLVRDVAHEKNVLFIDMYEKSRNLLINLGPEQSIPLFMHIEAGTNHLFPEGKTDNTHFREEGAKAIAHLFTEGLRELGLTALTEQLK